VNPREVELTLENERLRGLLATAKVERQRLAAEVQELRAGFLSSRQRIIEHEKALRAADERQREVESQNLELTNLYVAGLRLHATLQREDVLTAIEEIVVNLIGSEQFAVFEVGADGGLMLATSFGVDPAAWRTVPADRGPIGNTVVRGETWIAPAGPDANPIACVPLRLDGRAIGAIAIFRLLGHKPRLDAVDHALFELLSTQAGLALHSSKLQSSLEGSAA